MTSEAHRRTISMSVDVMGLHLLVSISAAALCVQMGHEMDRHARCQQGMVVSGIVGL